MKRKDRNIASRDAPTADRKRLHEAMRLQEIENNPLDAEQIAMFEMFEREGWSEERCLAHMRDRARRLAGTSDAAE